LIIWNAFWLHQWIIELLGPRVGLLYSPGALSPRPAPLSYHYGGNWIVQLVLCCSFPSVKTVCSFLKLYLLLLHCELEMRISSSVHIYIEVSWAREFLIKHYSRVAIHFKCINETDWAMPPFSVEHNRLLLSFECTSLHHKPLSIKILWANFKIYLDFMSEF